MHQYDIRDLRIHCPTRRGVVEAVRGVSFYMDQGECVALVGESGCGKSVTARSLMGLTEVTGGRCQPGSRPVKGVGRVRTIQGFYTLKPFDGGRLLSACSASGKPGDYDVFLSVNPCAAQKPVRKNYKIGKGRKTAYGMVWTRQGHHRMERVSG